MGLPLPTQTFYRMDDVTVASANIQGLLDAIFTALSDTVDVNGTTLPASHTWTWARFQNASVTESVYTTAVPAGPGVTPRIIFAGAASGSGTMVAPDTWVASNVHVGINKNSGSYNAWGNAAPFTSGQFSGYTRVSGTAANITSCVVRAYIGQESVFLDIIQAAASHWWVYVGAIIEPWTDDSSGASLVSETDNRLYGMIVSGGGGVLAAAFLSGNSSQDWLSHATGAGNSHGYVLQPNASGTYTCESVSYWRQAPSGQQADGAGKYSLEAVTMVRDSNTVALGRLRELYRFGLGQGGKTLKNGADELAHIIGVDTSTNDDCIALRST